MKEIDFLPEWYKSGKRREVNCRTQYIALGGIFIVMIVWNYMTTHYISMAKAEFTRNKTEQAQAQNVSTKLVELQNEMSIAQKRKNLIQKIDSKIKVANLLAEMSYLIEENIVLSKIELVAEKFSQEQDKEKSQQLAGVVRAIRGFENRQDLPLGNILFKIIIAGVAADASDVAALICKLENSPYFSQVTLSFSRDVEIERNDKGLQINQDESLNNNFAELNADGKMKVTKFQINCYLANYRQK